jgi:hypothetical protein
MMIFKVLILFLTANVANALVPPTNQEAAYISQKNILINPGFENGSAKWSASGGSFTITTTFANVGSGERAASWDSNAANQTFTSTAVPIPAGDYGANYEVSANLKCGSGTCTHLIQAFDGTNVIASQTITSSTTYTRTTLNFVAPTSGNISARIRSVAADEPVLYIDDVYLGRARNVGTVAQAEMVGTVSFSGCSTYWSTTSGSWTNYSPISGCTYSTTGSVLPPTTNIPGFRLVNQRPGKYVFRYIGAYGQINGFTTGCSFRFSDGSNNSQVNTVNISNASIFIPIISGHIIYESPVQNNTIQIQSIRTYGPGECAVTSGTVIEVYRYPLQSEIAVRPETQQNFFTGALNRSDGWISGGATSPANYADFSAGSGVTLETFVNENFGTVTPADGGLPGIKFTPKEANSVYHACFTYGVIAGSTSGLTSGVAITDGNNNILSATDTFTLTNTWHSSRTQCFLFKTQNTNPYNLKLRYVSNGSNAILIASGGIAKYAITVTIAKLSQSLPAPNLVGSVTSLSAGSLRIESVSAGGSTFGSICTSNPCTLYNPSSNWVSSITRSGEGNYNINILNGVFSSTPQCSFTLKREGVIMYSKTFGTNSNTVYNFTTYGTDGLGKDSFFDVICIGPRGSL